MVKRIDAKEIKGVTFKGFKTMLVKATIEPIWNESAYKIVVSLNLLGKIMMTLLSPVYIVLTGIRDTWDDITDVWTRGDACTYIFDKDDSRFEAVKEMYEEAKGE